MLDIDNNSQVHTLRVFTNNRGKFGNPLGIILDIENKISKRGRQKIATQLGYSESVFINNLDSNNISIFNPQTEVTFAGHAVLGTAWFLNKIITQPTNSLMCGENSIENWEDDDKTWIRARVGILPPWQYIQLKSAAEVENLSTSETLSKEHTFVWAWINENKGTMRARTFAPDWDIPEDEANGSGSMKLAATLNKDIEVVHGKGSVIYARCWQSDFADLGGRVVEEKNIFV